VLKGLIWYCAVADRPELKERALWLLQVKWRQQRNTEKAMTALSVFGVTKEELRAASLIKPEPPASSPRLLERLSRTTALSMRDRVQVDGDAWIVQGQLHFYRLSRNTGQIVRVTDGVLLDLNWTAIPDELRLALHRVCDSEEQLARRASFLAHDAVFGHYFQPVS
jgi:hypothetical protein